MKLISLLFLILISSASALAEDVIFEEGLQAFGQTLYPLLRQRCTACHGDGGVAVGHSVSDIRKAYKKARNYADFTNPMNSKFYDMVKVQHWIQHDPTQVGMTENEMVTGLTNWWNAGEKNVYNSYQLTTKELILPSVLPLMSDKEWLTLNWDLGLSDVKYKSCDFKIDIQQASVATNDFMGSYRVKNPQIRCQSAHFRFAGLVIAVSNESAVFENIYKDSLTQTTSSSDYSNFSSDIMILIQRRKTAPDGLKVLFKTIEPM